MSDCNKKKQACQGKKNNKRLTPRVIFMIMSLYRFELTVSVEHSALSIVLC